jgi:threonine/homoserine/homoserine lactone efflux protein
MTLPATLALFLVMTALAAIPSASVALVVTRSAIHGICNGAAVAVGIVLGDLVFVVLALLGMTALAETMGAFFAVFKYAGGAYLIWTGLALIRSRKTSLARGPDNRRSTLVSSLISGFLLTLGDIKAILFYASLFPAFLDLHDLGGSQIAMVAFVTIVAVGGVKLAYAIAARRIVRRFQQQSARPGIKTAAGSLMVGAGTYLVAKG